MGLITIIAAFLPLMLKLIERLRAKQASGQPLTRMERRTLNKALRAAAELRATALAMGINPDGGESARGTPEDAVEESTITPLTMEQFVELKRLLDLGDKATEEDWKKLEEMLK